MNERIRKHMAEVMTERLEAIGKTQAQLAEYLDVSPSSVSHWCQGFRAPRLDKYDAICEYLGISRDVLLGTAPKSTQRIPVFSYIHAGIPDAMIDDVVDEEDIPYDWSTDGRRYFGLKVKGDSMMPEYRDGDTIIVQAQPLCEDGDDCVVKINGDEAVLRRVVRRGGTLILQPLNPAYAPDFFTGASGEPSVSIAGVVVELRRQMR